MSSTPCILRVAIQTPLRRWFDYLPPDNIKVTSLVPGIRLRVPFGKGKQRTGLLLDVVDKSDFPPNRLKKVSDIIDETPLFSPGHLKLLQWASNYYQHPVGEVIFTTLPSLLRRDTPIRPNMYEQEHHWRLINADTTLLKKAPKQKAIVDFIKKFPDGVTREQLNNNFVSWQEPLKNLINKKYVETFIVSGTKKTGRSTETIKLNEAQQKAVTSILNAWQKNQAFLLNGVTGSGKTEIYLQCIQHAVNEGQQALVLLPEIGLTPQFIKRVNDSIDAVSVVLHSGLSDRERLQNWLKARDGEAQIILGTRSAVWIPLVNPGIIIVDEEHDLSFKQQDGFRYSARDIALYRGQHEKIPVVLGSATPSMESFRNVELHRFTELKLPDRAGNASLPGIRILDIRGSEMFGAFSGQMLDKIADCVKHKQQVLLFHNRRGYAPVVMCHDCGFVIQCPRCDVSLTYHKNRNRLCCHHCGHEEKVRSVCIECNGEQIIEVGYGTEKLVDTLARHFPEALILRIDRDTTRRKNSMHSMLETIHAGQADIMVGTQMLAKGHHFPNVSLVGIVDADRGLFSADYRASERMAQIITQVSGRAGRSDLPGEVMIQTHHPQHPLLTRLVNDDYENFAQTVLQERKQAELPPFSFHALLRAEATDSGMASRFLQDAKQSITDFDSKGISIFGPLPAPVEKRAGRYRLQLLLQAKKRNSLRQLLGPWLLGLESLKSSRKVRWSIDVDPQENI